MKTGLEQKLKKALAGRENVNMGQFQWLNLDMVKAEAGENWDSLSKKIYSVAAHFVEKRLSSDDFMVNCKGGFVIVFAGLSEAESADRVQTISRELNLFFLGDRILKHLKITSEVKVLSQENLAHFMSGITNSENKATAETSKRKATISNDKASDEARWKGKQKEIEDGSASWADGERGPEDGSASWADGERGPEDGSASWADGEGGPEEGSASWADGERDSEDRSASWEDGEQGPKEGSAAWENGEKKAQNDSTNWSGGEKRNKGNPSAGWKGSSENKPKVSGTKQACQPDQKPPAKQVARKASITKNSTTKKPTVVTRPAKPPSQEAVANTSFQDPPSWHDVIKKESEASDFGLPEAIFTESDAMWDDIIFKPCWDSHKQRISNYFCLARSIRNGHVLYGPDTLLESKSRDFRKSMDRSVAIAAQRGFQQLYVEGVTCAIAIPVHYDTIRGNKDRINYFSILQSVPQHLRKYFILRVDDIPKGAPISQMSELFRSMKCFGSGLLAHVEFEQTDVSMFEGCNIGLIGASVPSRINGSSISEDEINTMVKRTQNIRDLSAESYLTQVSDFGVLNAAVTAGVRYFAGMAVGVESALPGPVTPCTFADLYKRGEVLERQRLSG